MKICLGPVKKEFRINWDGRVIDIDNEGEKNIDVPALDEFSISTINIIFIQYSYKFHDYLVIFLINSIFIIFFDSNKLLIYIFLKINIKTTKE